MLMLASSSHLKTEKDNPATNPDIDLDLELKDSSNKLPDELVELDLESSDPEHIARRGSSYYY